MGNENKRLVSINRVVNAALLDGYEDIGKSKELYLHWAGRGAKKLNRETLKVAKRRVLLKVNANTKTAQLPCDFDYETFVGVVNEHGYRESMPLHSNLTSENTIETIECEDKCKKCDQDLSICNDMTVTVSTETVDVNGTSATKTTTKKLYSDGRYYLETEHPYWDTVTEQIEYATTKEFITQVDLKPCGCIETTTENIERIRNCNRTVYDCYFTECSPSCNVNLGGYKIFEENGLIQLDWCFPYDYIYLEYQGFMLKVNGQYAVPEVAFETLVEWIKFKAIANKKNVTAWDKNWQLSNYNRERRNMLKALGQVSLSSIILAARSLPNFEIVWSSKCSTVCRPTTNSYVSQITSSECSATVAAANCCDKKLLTPFQLAVVSADVSGKPIPGSYTYQNNELIGALNLDYIIVNNNTESKLRGDFTFDSTTGIITRVTTWAEGDVLIAPFAKLI